MKYIIRNKKHILTKQKRKLSRLKKECSHVILLYGKYCLKEVIYEM